MTAAPLRPAAPERLTPAEYLARERVATHVRSELVDGVVRAMTGASASHNRIVGNIAGLLFAQLEGRPCDFFVADLRVRVGEAYVYPDAVALCGPPRFEDDVLDTLLNPQVVVEVLSPSTESFDRGEKFRRYRRIPSLVEYVLVAQDAMRVEHYRREGIGWVLTEHEGPLAECPLATLQATLPLGRLYGGVPIVGPPGAADPPATGPG